MRRPSIRTVFLYLFIYLILITVPSHRNSTDSYACLVHCAKGKVVVCNQSINRMSISFDYSQAIRVNQSKKKARHAQHLNIIFNRSMCFYRFCQFAGLLAVALALPASCLASRCWAKRSADGVYHAICITQGSSSSSSFDLRLIFFYFYSVWESHESRKKRPPERLIIIIIIQTVAPAERCTHTTLETDRKEQT